MDVASRHQQDLTIRRLAWPHPLIGLKVGFSEQAINHLLGLARIVQSQGCCGERLSTAEHNVAEPEGKALLFKFSQLGFPFADA